MCSIGLAAGKIINSITFLEHVHNMFTLLSEKSVRLVLGNQLDINGICLSSPVHCLI